MAFYQGCVLTWPAFDALGQVRAPPRPRLAFVRSHEADHVHHLVIAVGPVSNDTGRMKGSLAITRRPGRPVHPDSSKAIPHEGSKMGVTPVR
jgi:hypothetical protein